MANECFQDNLVFERIQALGVRLLSEWDALSYLYRHSACLGSAAQIASYIGHDKDEIGAALHRLEVLGLVKRSRICRGLRLYRFSAPADTEHGSRMLDLMSLTQNRPGRLLILKYLRNPGVEPRRRRHSGLRLA